jgi:radical SAM protein with 4Fe4S-binding SPASM domain
MDQIEWILQNINKYGSEMREAAKKHMGYGSWDPFLNGDPLANPRLPEIMRLGKKLAPGIDVEVYTCGSLTDNAWMLCSRDVDLLHVTLSAHNPEIYRKVHRGDQFGNVLRTLKYITENRKSNQKLYINYIMTETNIPYMHEWYKLIGDQFPDWQRIFSPLIISPDNVYAKAALGKLSLQDQENAIRDINPDAGMWYAESTSLRQPCALWANASVLADGTLVKCCNWYDPEKHNYGNIKDYMKNGYDLHDFWMMRIANKHNNAVCESCTLRRADAKERLDKMKVKITVVT